MNGATALKRLAVAESGWWTRGTVTVSSGTTVKSFHDISKAVEHALGVSMSQHYRRRTLEVCYIGPVDAFGVREGSGTVIRSLHVAHGECVNPESNNGQDEPVPRVGH